jgi:hypothetical protein
MTMNLDEQLSQDRASTLAERSIIAGARVKISEAVERYPSAFVNTGERGTVTQANGQEVYVKLDSEFEGLAEWGNELHFYLDDPNHWLEVLTLEVLPD